MVYVSPHMTIGLDAGAHEVVLSAERVAGLRSSAGTADLWKKRLAGYYSGNSRLLLSVSMAFAAVLLPFSAIESGGLHFIGSSSLGKTTVARAAASVLGGPDYMQRWRATINGLEAVAALHSCALLILDEMGQVDPREVGESSYMLANGQGKQRATKTGAASEMASAVLEHRRSRAEPAHGCRRQVSAGRTRSSISGTAGGRWPRTWHLRESAWIRRWSCVV